MHVLPQILAASLKSGLENPHPPMYRHNALPVAIPETEFEYHFELPQSLKGKLHAEERCSDRR
jgi:hypothetical protein